MERGSTPPTLASFVDGATEVIEVIEDVLIALAAGKTTRPGVMFLRSITGLDTEWALSLKTTGPTYDDLITGDAIGAGVNMVLAPDLASFDLYEDGAADSALVLRITGTVPTGGDLTIFTPDTTQV